ncbi:cytochrome P450, family 82, subfamily C, polypeptide 4 [Hibiscus trionum]|uniref:Cytochrome P450, family 82, subfamily C, polypeptide 4 n=2 Tax=Hibiscus trionum TaxID=183268 RepID=A0A9W7LTR3_HIBTR|nr:cytochrome P450, family 82, subfamily C, polypeptide 4 [Hibiscus trionum]
MTGSYMDILLHYWPSILVATLVTLLIYKLISRSGKNGSVPEAGGAWPVIGHLHLFSSKEILYRTLFGLSKKYGPVFSIRLGSHKALVVGNMEMAKELLTVHDKAFATRPSLSASKLLGYNYAMFGFAPYGDYWREIRKITTLELLSNHRLDMANFKQTRASEVQIGVKDLYSTWMTKRSGDQGSVMVDMKQWFADLTHNLAFRIVVGKRYYGDTANSNEGEARQCQKSIKEYFHLFGTFVLSDAIPFLWWLDLGGHKKSMKRVAKELDVFVQTWLDEHKQKRRSGGEREEDQDFMDVMLTITEDAKLNGFDVDADTITKATCLNLILGAADSNMVPLIWGLALLLNNRHALKKAKEELDIHVGKDRHVEESDIKNLVYLQAIVKETLRLYPPSPILALRAAMEECTLSNGYHVTPGTRLLLNAWQIQHDQHVWTDPDEFKPERFLTTHKDLDLKGQNFELLPFGAGRRACSGVSLALQVIHLSMASVLHCFDIDTPGGQPVDMTESASLANVKATPLKVLLKPCLSDKLYQL